MVASISASSSFDAFTFGLATENLKFPPTSFNGRREGKT